MYRDHGVLRRGAMLYILEGRKSLEDYEEFMNEVKQM